MAKVKAPLFGFGASGQLGGAIVYFPWKGINAVREYVVPANPRSALQIAQRNIFGLAVDYWHANTYSDPDRIAWNRYAGVLEPIMSGFNSMISLCIARQIVGPGWNVISQVEVDTPTVVGFDVDVENSVVGLPLRARIGTSRTHFPFTPVLVDDLDGTYSLTWAGGASGVDYYVYIEHNIAAVWYRTTGIYHVRSA